PTTVNYARHVYIRDIMVANGDEHKPIWISEAGWNPVPEPSEVAEVDARYNFGQVSDEQAARYAPIAYQRAQEDWPWIGPMFYWFFRLPDESRSNESMYYFRFADPDFTPRPIYASMRNYITTQTPTLYAGVHQAEDWAVTLSDDAVVSDDDDAQFGRVVRTNEVIFSARGTDVTINLFGADVFPILEIDGNPVELWMLNMRSIPDSFGYTAPIYQSNTAETHTYRLFADDRQFSIDSITVIDRTFENLFGLVAGAVIGIGGLVIVVVAALWRRRHP
ncbi:MAG: hypothetical protein H7175_06825, partial [Burkholderiales bacterium]|nr:hypothetical protein [Anaerolineae bacterium]